MSMAPYVPTIVLAQIERLKRENETLRAERDAFSTENIRLIAVAEKRGICFWCGGRLIYRQFVHEQQCPRHPGKTP